MKKYIRYNYLLIAIPLLALFLISLSVGPAAGLTGSPGDNYNTCIICHTSASSYTAYGLNASITTNIPSEGYSLGQTYNITVTLTTNGATEYGFEITAENELKQKVGTFVITDATNTHLRGGNAKYVTQTVAGSDLSTWRFNWTAPTTNVSAPITFYMASIAGRLVSGQHTTANTQMVLTSKLIGGVLAVNDSRLLQFSMYPNPSDTYVTLQLPFDTNKANVKIFDYLGKILIQKNLNNTNNNLDISNLSTGIYFVRIQSDTKVGTKKLVVR